MTNGGSIILSDINDNVITQKLRPDIITQATCVTSIAGRFDYALPTISRHFKNLKMHRSLRCQRVKKIYIWLNIESMKEIAEYFKVLVEDYEKGTVFSMII